MRVTLASAKVSGKAAQWYRIDWPYLVGLRMPGFVETAVWVALARHDRVNDAIPPVEQVLCISQQSPAVRLLFRKPRRHIPHELAEFLPGPTRSGVDPDEPGVDTRAPDY